MEKYVLIIENNKTRSVFEMGRDEAVKWEEILTLARPDLKCQVFPVRLGDEVETFLPERYYYESIQRVLH